MDLLSVTLTGLFAGVAGTGLGGMMTVLFQQPSNRRFSALLGFSAGIMLAVVAFDLMPEAFELASIWWGILGLLLGVLLLATLDLVVPHVHFFGCDAEHSRLIRSSVFVGLGIAMHNLPEGLAIGASFTASPRLGMGIALLMSLQNLPEGMAMAVPMLLAKVRISHIVSATALAGVPMGIGALVGGMLGAISPVILAVSLAFAAGAMLFVTCDELIPNAQALSVGHSGTYGIVTGIVVGILISTFVHL